jgi:sulfur relay (sulfurtransferase) complex TusBCD TusD component (DsrE family)
MKPHYCRICQQYKANEKFSGHGHAAHICKACANRGNKPPEAEPEPLVFIERHNLDESCLAPIEDIDSLPFLDGDEPPDPKKSKRKSSTEKLIRSVQKKKAKFLLRKLLARGEVNVKIIQQAANDAGISREALRRAKGSLKATHAYTEHGAVWRLPAHKKNTEPTEDSANGGG